MPRAAVLLILVAGVVTSATGRDVERDAMAATLGRAHALHRLCAGPSDDLWRGRMQAMLIAERATPALRSRLVERFNAGFAEAAAQYPTCSSRSRAALAQTARRGRDQATALAQAIR